MKLKSSKLMEEKLMQEDQEYQFQLDTMEKLVETIRIAKTVLNDDQIALLCWATGINISLTQD